MPFSIALVGSRLSAKINFEWIYAYEWVLQSGNLLQLPPPQVEPFPVPSSTEMEINGVRSGWGVGGKKRGNGKQWNALKIENQWTVIITCRRVRGEHRASTTYLSAAHPRTYVHIYFHMYSYALLQRHWMHCQSKADFGHWENQMGRMECGIQVIVGGVMSPPDQTRTYRLEHYV